MFKRVQKISLVAVLLAILLVVFYSQTYDHKVLKRYVHDSIIPRLYPNSTLTDLETTTTTSSPNDAYMYFSTDTPGGTTKAVSSVCDDVINRYNISKKRFVMALSYWEQLTMATTNLCSLIAFSRHWQARTVSPFTRNAEMWGLPSTVNYPIFHGMPPIYKGGPGKPIGSLFNTTVFNSHMLCAKYDIPPLADFDDFILNANRSIRLLHFNFFAYGYQIPKSKAFGNDSNYINCHNYSTFHDFSMRLLIYLNNVASQRGLPHFTVDAACCVNHRHLVTPEEMARQCGFHDLDSFTIIVTIWRGYSEFPTKKFRLVVPPDSPVLRRPSSSDSVYPLNDDILSNVTAYYNTISGGRDFIAVHIRTAKLGMLDYVAKRRLSTKCFSLVWDLISQLKKQYEGLPIKYFVDYGPYGSHSSEIGLGKRVSKRPFAQRNIIPLHYNPAQYGGWTDQGYVALVEQSAVSKAKVLVLLGGGSFQDQILTRFKHRGKGDGAYTLCWSKDSLFVNKIVL